MEVYLATQETQVRSLVWEDPTCCGATKPVHHNYTTLLQSPCSGACEPQPLKPTGSRIHIPQLESRSPSPQLEKAHVQQQRPSADKNTHVNPWLIHVNVWQKPLQYCKIISLQLIKINEKNEKKKKYCLSAL